MRCIANPDIQYKDFVFVLDLLVRVVESAFDKIRGQQKNTQLQVNTVNFIHWNAKLHDENNVRTLAPFEYSDLRLFVAG